MALVSVDSKRHPSVRWRTFAAGAARVLHSTDAPAEAQFLPHKVVAFGGAGVNFVFVDVDGVTNTVALPASSIFMIEGCAELTAANGAIVLVGWQAV